MLQFIADIVALTPSEAALPRAALIEVLSKKITGFEGRLVDDDSLTLGHHPSRAGKWVVAGNIKTEVKPC
jgi:hypothetical protein